MGLRSRCYFRTVKARGVCEPQEEAYSNAASHPPTPTGPDRPTDRPITCPPMLTRSLTHIPTEESYGARAGTPTPTGATNRQMHSKILTCMRSHPSRILHRDHPQRAHMHRPSPQPLQTTQNHSLEPHLETGGAFRAIRSNSHQCSDEKTKAQTREGICP